MTTPTHPYISYDAQTQLVRDEGDALYEYTMQFDCPDWAINDIDAWNDWMATVCGC